MNRLVRKFTYKNIFNRKSKAPLIVICVAVICFMIFICMIVPTFIRNINNDVYKVRYGESDIGMNIRDINVANFDDIAKLTIDRPDLMEKIEYMVALFLFRANYEHMGNKFTFNIYAGDYQTVQKIFPFKLQSNITHLKRNEVIVSSAIAEKFNYKVGDKITVGIDGASTNVVIADIGKGGIFYDEMTYGIFSEKQTLDSTIGLMPTIFNFCSIKLKNRSDLTFVMDELSKIYTKFDINLTFSEAWFDISLKQAIMPFILSAIIVVFFCFLIIFSSLNLLFSQRAPQYATLRSMGALDKHIASSMMLESLFYGLLGGVLGTILNIAFLALLKNSLHLTFITGIDSKSYILAFLLTLLMAIISGIIPTLKNFRKSIRDEIVAKIRMSKFQICIILTIFIVTLVDFVVLILMPITQIPVIRAIMTVALLLGVIYTFPYFIKSIVYVMGRMLKKKNFTSTYLKNNITLPSTNSSMRIISVGLFIVMFVLSLIDYLALIFNSSQWNGGDYFVSDLTGQCKVMEEDLKEKFEIDNIFTMTQVNLTKTVSENPILIYGIYGMDEKEMIEKFGGKIVGDKDAVFDKIYNANGEKNIIINLSYLYTKNLNIGDEIEIIVDASRQLTEKFVVVGYFNGWEDTAMNMLTSRKILNDATSIEYGNVIWFTNDSGKYTDTEILDYIQVKYKSRIRTYDELMKQDRDMSKLLLTVFYGYAFVVIIMCLIVFGISISFSLLQLVNQHKVMAAFGLTKDKFNKLIILTFTLICALSAVFGTLMFVLLMMQVTGLMVWTDLYIPFSFSTVNVLTVALVTIISSIATTFLYVRKHFDKYISVGLGKTLDF